MTLTVECRERLSATALRNLHDAPADEEAGPGAAAQGGVAAQTPHRDGAARPVQATATSDSAPSPQPATPDLKRGREAERGGESYGKGREAKPHRDEHQKQATARGAE